MNVESGQKNTISLIQQVQTWMIYAKERNIKVSCYRRMKLRLTAVGDPLRWPRHTPLSIKVGIKFCLQVAVAQSV
jgi:hypothetical protein